MFFWRSLWKVMCDCMEDTLLSRAGVVGHKKITQEKDEEITPVLGSVVIKDWLIALGGQRLFEHCCQVYAKDPET